MMVNSYVNIARLYDADNRDVFTEDIPFYLNKAQHLGGKALELACGTGRVTIPLAEAGIHIWGLDFSKSMLNILEEKKSKLSVGCQQHLHIIHGDMSNFSLSEKFNLIIIPFRSFQALEDDEQAFRCLSHVHQHLEEDGQFIINVFKPIKEFGDWWINTKEKLDFEANYDGYEKVTRHSIRKHYDTTLRLLYTEYIYRLYSRDGDIEEYRDPIRLRYFYEEDIKTLLQQAGFIIEEAYGWYDGTPLNEGNEFIFVCKKALKNMYEQEN